MPYFIEHQGRIKSQQAVNQLKKEKPFLDALRALPDGPGVYRFIDQQGNILYIGKAKSLKQRVPQYFHRKAEQEERAKQLLFHIADVQWDEVPTELHALLLEDRLIKANWPPYNIRQKQFLRYCYLALEDVAFPFFKVIEAKQKGDFVQVWGPFSGEETIQEIICFMADQLQLRTCFESFPKASCSRRSLQQCLGPCDGTISQEEYRQRVNIAEAFLSGEINDMEEILRSKMIEASQQLDFERAGYWHRQLQLAQKFTERRWFWLQSQQFPLWIEETPTGRSYLLENGIIRKYWKRRRKKDQVEAQYARKLEAYCDEQEILYAFDRVEIVHTWLRRYRKETSFCFLAPPPNHGF